MIEGQRVVGYVFDRLVADNGAGGVHTLTSGRIYRDMVPQTATLPAVTVSLVSHTDLNTLGGVRAFATTLVDVRVVSDGGVYATSIADRVDTLLQNAAGTEDGVTVVELRRDGVQAFVEADAGKLYAHLITTWRTEAYA